MRFIPIFFLLFQLAAYAQKGVAINQWKAHPSLYNFNTVHKTDNAIFAGSDETLMRISLEDNEVSLLSKVDGLNDVGISRISHHKDLNITLIAYKNGNIDLLKENTVVNINDIKRSPTINGSKRINHILFRSDFAYLSTDFGLVVLNLIKNEIKESALNINSSGTQIQLYSSTFHNDSIYIATSDGLYASNINSNLLSFESWLKFDQGSGIPVQYLSGVEVFQGDVYAIVSGYYSNSSNQVFLNAENEGLYKKENSTWTRIHTFKRPVYSITGSPEILSIASFGVYYDYTQSSFDSVFVAGIVKEVDNQNPAEKWVALNTGVSRCFEGYCYPIEVSTLNYSEPFNLVNHNNRLACLYGGYYSNTLNKYNANGFDVFTNYEWVNFSQYAGNFDRAIDLVDIAYNPVNDISYIASYGRGLFLYKDGKALQHYTDANSPLVNLTPGSDFVRTTSIDVGKDGKIWMANAVQIQSQPVLHSINPDGQWASYALDIGSGKQLYLLNLSVDNQNNKWFIRRNISGLVVFNENNVDKNYRILSKGTGVGNLPSDNVISIEVDHNQDIWVGTEEGIAIFKAGSDPFTDDAQIPYYEGFPLLMDKQINDIEVDGGNRKWVATNNGLWLFNEDATEVLQNFTAENSPLPSNDIKQVEVDGTTGEVFVLTDFGLISFRGDATESSDTKNSDVKVFPNPVRSGFDGLIAVTGLVKNAPVKITDIFGNLVYETKANGGTATWSGYRLNGKRAESGVYLVFSSTKDGEEGNIAKIVLLE